MFKRRRIYNFRQLYSSITVLVVLLWLTVCPSFVQATWTEKQKQEKASSGPINDCTDCPSEESKEDSTPMLKEFLSEQVFDIHTCLVLKETSTTPSMDNYISFYPQLISPPPES